MSLKKKIAALTKDPNFVFIDLVLSAVAVASATIFYIIVFGGK